MHHDLETCENVMRLVSKGLGVRAIASELGMCTNTVNRIINKCGDHSEWFQKEALKGAHLTEVQFDELWTFNRQKNPVLGADPGSPEAEYGEKWVWSAIETRTRLFVAWHAGGHELEDCRVIVAKVDALIRADPVGGLPLFTSDQLPHYRTVLLEFYHYLIFPPRTGKAGRPAGPREVPLDDLVFGTVRKEMRNGKVVKVHRVLEFGTFEQLAALLEQTPSNTINTSFIERLNGTLRSWNSNYKRKSQGFAKSMRWLKAKLALFTVFYNFVHPHGTLSKKKGGAGRPTTPAMAAQLTDHPWSHYEWLSFPVARV
jgi:IS1 family transposase